MKNTYRDFDDLVGDVKDYVRSNPNHQIVENDDPINLTIKYEDEKTNKSWEIKIADLYIWMKEQDENRADLIRRALASREGKQALLDVILEARK